MDPLTFPVPTALEDARAGIEVLIAMREHGTISEADFQRQNAEFAETMLEHKRRVIRKLQREVSEHYDQHARELIELREYALVLIRHGADWLLRAALDTPILAIDDGRDLMARAN